VAMLRTYPSRFFLFVFLIVLLGITARVSWTMLATSDGSMFRHDAQHTGRSPNIGPQPVPTLEWSFATPPGAPIYASPVIAPNGNILASTVSGTQYLFFPSGAQIGGGIGTSSTLWSTPAFDTNGWFYYGAIDSILPPGSAGSGILVAYCSPSMGCPDATNRWDQDLDYPAYSSPLITPDGAVVIGSGDLAGPAGAVGT
jgi:hypothetical protein